MNRLTSKSRITLRLPSVLAGLAALLAAGCTEIAGPGSPDSAIALTVLEGRGATAAVLGPAESQRLRGLGDRVFLVDVTVTFDPFGLVGGEGATFDNCYVFDANGDWSETGAPTAWTWSQDSNGAKTSYVVNAFAPTPDGPVPVLQLGQVTPAGGRGVLQVVAETFAIPGAGPDGRAVAEFLSVGHEIDESEMEGLCPTLPPPPEE